MLAYLFTLLIYFFTIETVPKKDFVPYSSPYPGYFDRNLQFGGESKIANTLGTLESSHRKKLSSGSLHKHSSVLTSPGNSGRSTTRRLGDRKASRSRSNSIHDEKNIYRFSERSSGWKSAKDFFQSNEEVSKHGISFKQ